MGIFQKIFKKKEPEVQIVEVLEGKIEGIEKRYSDDIEQIHREFEFASELLMQEACSIIREAESRDVNKVNRLENIGFKNVKQVQEVKPLLEKAKISKEQVDLLKNLAIKYPNNKFITEDQVKEICSKYNLVCGDIERFRGFVPEKNLSDMEKFLSKYECFQNMYVGVNKEGEERNFDMSKFEIGESTSGGYEHFYLKNDSRVGWRRAHAFQRSKSSDDDFYGSVHEEHLKILGINSVSDFYYRITKQSLKICAPIKDMDTTGLRLVDGYKLKKHIPDPVVLQPIQGGYLIVTAWGDEASDPLVVNEKFN